MTRPDDARIMDLAIRMLFLGLFLYGGLLIVAPLTGVVIWAVILAVAVYPLHASLSRLLGGFEAVSATILTLVGLGLTVGPLAASISGLAEVIGRLVSGIAEGTLNVPPPPERITELPIIGKPVTDIWTMFERDVWGSLKQFGPQITQYGGTFAGTLARLGADVFGMIASLIVMGLLLKPGPRLAGGLRKFANRVFDARGGEFVGIAGATVRNVSRGVLGVAAIQAVAAGILMMVFGVPAAGPLAILCLILGIVQVGPGVVLIPVVIWGWTTMPTWEAALFTALAVPVMLIDNVLRPIFIARGLRTPMLVILIGVLGGMLSFGLIGIFVGPVLLSVLYELIVLWMGEAPIDDAPEPETAQD